MLKSYCTLVVGTATAVLLVAAAGFQQAGATELLVNGNFSAGNTGFSSGYTYVNPGSNPTGNNYPNDNPATNPNAGSWYEATYTIDTNPNLDHTSWSNFDIGTSLPAGAPATNYAMIVNGDALQRTVWSESVNLVAGQTYEFSAYATSIYPGETSPANLSFTIGGNSLSGSPMLLTNGNGGIPNWEKFDSTFTASVSETVTLAAVTDLNSVGDGNDFAVTDLSLNSVPEPSSFFALTGLCGMGLVGLVWRRRM